MRIRHDYLRELRLRFGKTQSEIANEAGVDIRTYRKYETGEIVSLDKALRASQYEFLRNLAAYYDLKGGPDELLVTQELPTVSSPPAPDILPTSSRFVPLRYVSRPAEEARARRLLERPGTPVVVHAPERFGASRFLGYLLHQEAEITNTSRLVIRINLARTATLAASQGKPLLASLADQILARAAEHPQQAAERSKVVHSLPTTERGKLCWLLEQYVLPSAPCIYLAIEHADAAVEHCAQPDFFASLRSWAAARDHALWSRLRIILTTSTDPSILEQPHHSDFFAQAHPIRLEEFNRDQLMQMGSFEGVESEAAVDRLMYWIGGNPYLARLARKAAFERALDLGDLIDDELVRRSVFSHHLLYLRHAVERRRGMIDAMARIASAGGAQIGIEDYCFLHKKGLVVEGQSGVVSLRCRLYREYFLSVYQRSDTEAAR